MMKIPETIVDCIETLLHPYDIDFRTILERETTKADDPKWIPLTEAAKLAAMSKWTLRRRIAQGLIEACKSSGARCGRILVLRSSLVKYMEEIRIVPVKQVDKQ